MIENYRIQELAGWDKVAKEAHFFDRDKKKVDALEKLIQEERRQIPSVNLDICSLDFTKALETHEQVLQDSRAAKLLIIDQFGVDAVSDEVFLKLISYPTTDFIFFLSSSTLHRFRDHPAIKQKISNPEDSYHVHRAAFDYYKELVPKGEDVFLGQFSIRKRSNIYDLIFGSRHPLGIHKFLELAWRTDEIAGEANFDVDRENISPGELLLGLDVMKPKKRQSFEESLERVLRERRLLNEADMIHFCIEAGMTGKHAEPVITKLKKEQFIDTEFRVPNVRNWKKPRSITYL